MKTFCQLWLRLEKRGGFTAVHIIFVVLLVSHSSSEVITRQKLKPAYYTALLIDPFLRGRLACLQFFVLIYAPSLTALTIFNIQFIFRSRAAFMWLFSCILNVSSLIVRILFTEVFLTVKPKFETGQCWSSGIKRFWSARLSSHSGPPRVGINPITRGVASDWVN